MAKERRSEGELAADCSICLEKLEKNLITLPKCGHTLHSKCFCEYVESKRQNNVECPLCRTILIKTPPLNQPTVQHMTFDIDDPLDQPSTRNERVVARFIIGLYIIGTSLLMYALYVSSASCAQGNNDFNPSTTPL